MVSRLDDLAFVVDQDLVSVSDGAETVGDHETGPALH